jgi:endoglucanase
MMEEDIVGMSKKKLTALLLCVSMCTGLAACGGVKQTEAEESAQEEQVVEETAQEESPEEDVEEDTEEITSLMGYNMIENGDFANDADDWHIYLNGGKATSGVENEMLTIPIQSVGTLEHSVQIYYDGFALETGCVYEMSFDAASTEEREVQYRIQINGGDYHAYTMEEITLTPEMQHFDFTFTMEEGSDPAPRLCFNMGVIGSTDENIAEHTVTFDNFELYCIDESGRVLPQAAVDTPDIQVNQLGYRPDDSKVAVFRGEDIDTSFAVVDTTSGETVFEGTLEAAQTNKNTRENESQADFSALTTPGTYKVVGEKCGESYEFEIGEDVYDEAFDAVVKMLYLQRCGEELPEEYAGDYAHAVCHDSGAVISESTSGATIDVSGGWHDAGDYGRYVVSGAKAVADIMLAYESNPDAFSDAAGIPESGNGTPDILDEAKYELDWLLKMQDSATGGVYHKVTCANFPETVMPEDETDQLIVSPISNCATGDFAAVMAMAARVYQDIDSKYADTCLAAAQKAVAYLEKNENGTGFVNPEDIVTGEYGDTDDSDERFWAYAELFKTTGNVDYEKTLAAAEVPIMHDGLGWQNVSTYGGYAYLTSDYTNKTYAETVREKMQTAVEKVAKSAAEDTYQCSLKKQYPWGSNMSIANNGVLLLMFDEINGTTQYENLAKAQMDYLLGNNANSYCFVTGFGSLSPQQPHHRPSQVVDKAMAGMLVGGADSSLEDPYAQATLSGTAPAKCYVDNVQSYSCNEVTVYWNSPLIYLMSAF